MDDKIKLVLHNVQQSASCHQKYLKILENHYHKIPFEDFIKELFNHLSNIFRMDIAVRNLYVERTLDFLAQFVSALTKPNETEPQVSIDEDSPSHPFLTQIIYETLRFHDLSYVPARYYSCRFITLILQHIGYETHLDNDICDSIQESMLERILDPKASIRLQAVMALVRLQEPLNPDCPVIKAYLSLLVDANPLIRKEIIKRIAPNAITIPKISERIRDVDYHVRIAAYARCADIGPKLFKIIVRQQILKCGFHDSNKHVKLVFMENLLPKWLTAYNGDFLAFLSALKLDADENDIVNTEEISKQVMEVFFRNVPVKEIIDALPLDDDKLIPLNNLTSEVITYWNIVTNFLRSSDETEEYLDNILPELTPFCKYIQSIIDSKTSKKMEEWEYLDYQYILYNLFDMAEQYDLGDEVGRRTFQNLVMSILQNHKLQFKLAKKVVGIADKLLPSVDVLSNEICQIISDIREPLVDQPASRNEIINNSFQIAELKVKINILQGKIEDALDSQDFQKASVIKTELMEYKSKLEDLNKQNQVVKVKVSKDDPETICRCLDLLSALLELPSVNCLSPALATCKSEFLLPLLTSDVVEVNWRVLKCLALICIFDKSLAEEHSKVLCIPIATYRAIPNYNKFALMQSVAAVCDLMRVHGSELFGSEEDTNNTGSQHNTTRRRLYRNEDMDDVTVMDHNRLNVEFIIEIILDMLDDENEEIREIATTGISKLILTDFPVSPLLISRIILKWFNPLTEKAGDRIQQKLGTLISNYTKGIKDAREIIGKAVIPTLTSIASAPRTSPLADVDIENVVRFLAAITNSNETTGIVHIHTNLAHTLYYKIASKPKDPIVQYLSKMLLYLEIPGEKSASIKELITEFDLLLEEGEDGLDKGPRKTVTKFVEKLRASLRDGTVIEGSLGNTESSIQQTNNTNDRTDVDNTIETTKNDSVRTETMRRITEGSENDKSVENINSVDERIPEELVANEQDNLQIVTYNTNEKGNGDEIIVGKGNDAEQDADNVRKRTRKSKNEEEVKNSENKLQTGNLTETDGDSNNEQRRSKRQKIHSTQKSQIRGHNRTNVRNIATSDSTTEPDSDSTVGERTPLRPRRVSKQPGPNDNKISLGNKSPNSSDIVTGTSTETVSDNSSGVRISPRVRRILKQTGPPKNKSREINLRRNRNPNSIDRVTNTSKKADGDNTAGDKSPLRQRLSKQPDSHEHNVKETNLRKSKNLNSAYKALNASSSNTTEADSDTGGEKTSLRQRRVLRQPDPYDNKIRETNLRKRKSPNSGHNALNASSSNTTEADSDTAGEKSPLRERRVLRQPEPCDNKNKETNLRKNKNLNSGHKPLIASNSNTTEADSDTAGEKSPQRQRRVLRQPEPCDNKNKETNLRKNKNLNSGNKTLIASSSNTTEADSDTAGEKSPQRQRRVLRQPEPCDNKNKETNLRKNKNLNSGNKTLIASSSNTTEADSDTAGEKSPLRQRRVLRQPEPCDNKNKGINLRKNKNLNSGHKPLIASSSNTTEADSDASGEKSPLRQRRVLRQPEPCDNKIKETNLRKNKNLNSGHKSIKAKNKNAMEERLRILNRKRKIEKTANKNTNNESDTTTTEESEKAKSTTRRSLQRTRRLGRYTPVVVITKINTRNAKKIQSNNRTNRNDKINKAKRNFTTDREVNSEDNMKRRSKRPRKSLEKSDSSQESKESEKENKSKNDKKQPVLNVSTNEADNTYDRQTRRSTGHNVTHPDLTINKSHLGRPVAESTKNTIRMSLRNNTSMSSTESVNGTKRRKSRGKKSQDLDSTGDTTLHTIIEQSNRMSILDDSFQTPISNSSSQKNSRNRNSSVFSTPTSTISRRSKLIITETSSDSEFGSPIRKSTRKIKKKNMDNYVL